MRLGARTYLCCASIMSVVASSSALAQVVDAADEQQLGVREIVVLRIGNPRPVIVSACRPTRCPATRL